MAGTAPTIDRFLSAARQRLIDREAATTGRLMTAYETSWRRIDAELTILERQFREAVAAGIDVTPEWVTRQAYWKGLQASIEAEMVVFEQSAARVLGEGQRQAVVAARSDARALLAGLGLSGAGGDLRPGVMQRWISATDPKSPLRKVIRRYGKDIGATIENAITEGLGVGRGSSGIVRRIRVEIGPEAMQPRMVTLVRTETHRAYRGAQRQQYAELQTDGVIVGYQWHAHLGPRTCGACLAMHGRTFPAYPNGHHPNCRCSVRPIINPEYLPGGSRMLGSGEDWLRAQDEKVQRAALGTNARFKAFKGGETLESMTIRRPNATWGPSVGLTSPGGGGQLPGNKPGDLG